MTNILVIGATGADWRSTSLLTILNSIKRTRPMNPEKAERALETQRDMAKNPKSVAPNKLISVDKPDKNSISAMKTGINPIAVSNVSSKQENTKKNKSKPTTAKTQLFRELGNMFRITLLNVLRCSNASLLNKIDHGGFHCEVCQKRFLEAAELKKHFIRIHVKQEQLKTLNFRRLALVAKLDITSLVCTLCEQEIDSIEALLEHLRSEHEKQVCTSDLVPFKFDKAGYRCVVCDADFGTFKTLLVHMHLHYQNHVCKVCEAGFYSRASLRMHHKNMHVLPRDEGSFPCPQCSKSYRTLDARREHINRVHLKNDKRHHCHVCSEKFKDTADRNQHCQEVHGLKAMVNYQCNSCPKNFKRSSGLSAHVRQCHLMERTHDCKFCDMSFWSICELKNHMVKHTGGDESFVCDKCNKAYSRKKVLRQHMKIHFPGKHVCDMCNRSFAQKCSLKYHLRTKHGLSLIEDVVSAK